MKGQGADDAAVPANGTFAGRTCLAFPKVQATDYCNT